MIERLLNRIQVKDIDDCWEWLGCTTRGYGRISINNKLYQVHRVVYEFAFETKIPKGKVIDHLCRNRGCANPNHLRVCSIGENVLAKGSLAIAKRNKDKINCGVCGCKLTVCTYDKKRRECLPCRRKYFRKPSRKSLKELGE